MISAAVLHQSVNDAKVKDVHTSMSTAIRVRCRHVNQVTVVTHSEDTKHNDCSIIMVYAQLNFEVKGEGVKKAVRALETRKILSIAEGKDGVPLVDRLSTLLFVA
jgi:hypothetical protein